MWALKMPDGNYRVTYIGETGTSFYQRTKEHVIQQLGGNYGISDPKALQEGRSEIVWNGLWRKGTRDKLPEFFRRCEELAPIAKAFLIAHWVFVAPLDCERRLRRRIEGAIALALRKGQIGAELLADDVRYYGRKPNAEPMEIAVTTDCNIDGFPLLIAA